MKPCGCPPRYRCWQWLRLTAQAEARALRALHRAHGRIPATSTTRWDWP